MVFVSNNFVYRSLRFAASLHQSAIMSARRSTRLSSQSTTVTTVQENGVQPGTKKRTKPSQGPETVKKAKANGTKSKATSSADDSTAQKGPPSTPLRSRKKQETTGEVNAKIEPNPVTPVPVKTSTTTPGRRRPAQPHTTNAPLQTPGGSKLVRYPTIQTPSASQAAAAVPEPATPGGWSMNDPETGDPVQLTTENLLEEAKKHLLTVDPNLKDVIEQHHCKTFAPDGLAEPVEPFSSLAKGIMGQQVSGAAAKAIEQRFIALFTPPPSFPSGGRKFFPSPAQVLALDIPTLRTAGLSQRKAEYITGLAEKFASGELSAQMLLTASDEEIMESLIAVRGLGRWSVEMFCIFGLKRMDVFSTGDLGVQRGVAKYLGRDVAKLKTSGKGKWKYVGEEEMVRTAERFRPFRSLFMWYMWRIEDVKTDVLES